MAVDLYRFPNKLLRSIAIKRYMDKAGYTRAVCFSCGNASAKLKEVGIDVLDISKKGDLEAKRWFEQSEIKRLFPDYFDATSGHIPIECMLEVAKTFKEYIGCLPAEIYLPTGSGETLLELKMAFPYAKITAVYNLDEATQYDQECILNPLVEIVADEIMFGDSEEG